VITLFKKVTPHFDKIDRGFKLAQVLHSTWKHFRDQMQEHFPTTAEKS
jgi:hypothetical protein